MENIMASTMEDIMDIIMGTLGIFRKGGFKVAPVLVVVLDFHTKLFYAVIIREMFICFDIGGIKIGISCGKSEIYVKSIAD